MGKRIALLIVTDVVAIAFVVGAFRFAEAGYPVIAAVLVLWAAHMFGQVRR